MQFITPPEKAQPEKAQPVRTHTPPPGYKHNPLYIETKSRRLQMLIQPSLYKRIQQTAKKHRLSVNAMIHELLESALDAEDAQKAQ